MYVYQTTERHIPEDSNLVNHRNEYLKFSRPAGPMLLIQEWKYENIQPVDKFRIDSEDNFRQLTAAAVLSLPEWQLGDACPGSLRLHWMNGYEFLIRMLK